MKRRDFFSVINGLVLVDLGHEWIASAVQRFPVAAQPRIGGDVVGAVEDIAASVQRLEGACDSGMLSRTVSAQLKLVAGLLRESTYGERDGRRLYAVTAELLRLSGWYAFDLGQRGPAQRYLGSSLKAAKMAGRDDIGAHVLSYVSIMEAWVGRSQDAVDVIESAMSAVDRVDPLMSSILYARAACAYGKAGDRRRVEEDIASSTLCLATAETGEADRPAWGAYFDQAMVLSQAGHSYLDLGLPDQAAARFSEALALRGRGPSRDRSMWSSRLAVAHYRLGDLEQACATGTQAVQEALDVQSARATDHVSMLLRELRPHHGDRRVRALRGQAKALLDRA